MRRLAPFFWLIAILPAAAAPLAAQGAAAPPAFDSASVHAAAPNSGSMSIETEPGGIAMHNVGLNQAIEWAWQIEPLQLSGPDWLSDARFDISGRAIAASDPAQLRLMLRTLLLSRFGLQEHRETRQVADYAIILARNGPHYHAPSAQDPSQFEASNVAGEAVFTQAGAVLIAQHASVADLASKLSTALQRPIVDRTGLAGRFDIRIDATAYATPARGDGDGSNRLDPITVIFNALPPQLGLRVEPGKDDVEFLVVDAINRTPTAN